MITDDYDRLPTAVFSILTCKSCNKRYSIWLEGIGLPIGQEKYCSHECWARTASKALNEVMRKEKDNEEK